MTWIAVKVQGGEDARPLTRPEGRKRMAVHALRGDARS